MTIVQKMLRTSGSVDDVIHPCTYCFGTSDGNKARVESDSTERDSPDSMPPQMRRILNATHERAAPGAKSDVYNFSTIVAFIVLHVYIE